jgi:hypothetical protein
MQPQKIERWGYATTFSEFLVEKLESILGKLAQNTHGSVEQSQLFAWTEQVRVLKELGSETDKLRTAKIYFELKVPRLGRRADVGLIVDHVLFLIEFKAGEKGFDRSAIEQVWDYALDYKNFHESSHNVCTIPILLATEAEEQDFLVPKGCSTDPPPRPVCIATSQLAELIVKTLAAQTGRSIDTALWEAGRYLPTPTIIEAARALYAGHHVSEISRSDAGATNLSLTSSCIDSVIENAKARKRKSICFVTGVPGAGKTLVGLDVANRHLDATSDTYSVFLSGNGPLVAVLREALARDRVEQAKAIGDRLRKGEARKEVESFIQNVHHFRDEYLKDTNAPPEHVVLFDEAQRAWDLEMTSSFMKRKRGLHGFSQSEPEFLISCLDRHVDWAVVVCLVGSGQEINTGEGGIDQWFKAILDRFNSWEVYLSPALAQEEYRGSTELERMLLRPHTYKSDQLHLATSMRSFRAETLSKFVRETLELEISEAASTLAALKDRYPVVLTRNVSEAKQWLREKARGSERYGIVVSSQAERLKPHAIDVRVNTDPVRWFLDGRDDTRSSLYLEDVATEFQVQGLELDWACVVWDGDLRFNLNGWTHHEFRGSKWVRINKLERKRYLENAYRVLMTRARQGMVLVVPEGDTQDPTRDPEIYDGTFEYLRSIGLQLI